MSKDIAVSEEVYEVLERLRRGRSFSEVILDALEHSGQLSDVVGQRVLTSESLEDTKDVIEGLSQGTLERLDEALPDRAT